MKITTGSSLALAITAAIMLSGTHAQSTVATLTPKAPPTGPETSTSAAPTSTTPYTGPYYVTNTTDPKITPSGLPVTGTYVAPTSPKYDYAEVLHKSLLFYHAQRSGKPPYRRLAWRGDSCLTCKGQYGEDLSGGYYEAANTMKWGLPLGFTITQLAFNAYAFPDAMKAVNEYNEAIEAVRYGTDYLINAHPSDNVLVGQLGVSAINTTDIDFGYFGPAEEYEKWVPQGIMHTPYYVTVQDPASDIAGETAAAMAAASVLFAKSDPAYAATLVAHSRKLYTFATTYQGSFMQSNQSGFLLQKMWYPSVEFTDELAWAATWLYVATNELQYLTEATNWYANATNSWEEYSWDSKGGGLHVLLYHLTKQDQFRTNAKSYFDQWLPGPSQKIKQTPRGLGFGFSWGSLRYAANVAFLMLWHAKDLGYNDPYSKQLTTFAIQQINYMLGDCGRSWVVGFGVNSPLRPYHKSSYNSYIDYPLRGQDQSIVGDDFLNSLTLQRFVLYGALVGGPAADDSYYDDRKNYEFTEVTQDYNAGFTGALAGLIDFYGTQNFRSFSDCGLDLGWSHPNASNPPTWPANDCYHTCNKNCTGYEVVAVTTTINGVITGRPTVQPAGTLSGVSAVARVGGWAVVGVAVGTVSLWL
ncbi:Six-hairpin glycosidase-like protein [Jimgerdemannia flammicorona]|uniref:Endoglucanase n=1 Tax=Jimgerdemannia flammicorona TaxID=994334 RepID=A0A433QL63_9FUNG|nr:Six-hairpin glycosidase-like protein [Jimgerdemannia flammicorona]